MKKILYISYICSDKVNEYIINTANKKLGQAAQKFHKLLVEGFVANKIHVDCLVGRPVTSYTHKKFYWSYLKETRNNIRYLYIPFFNLSLLKYIFFFFFSFFFTLIWCLKHYKNSWVICDVLCSPIAHGAFYACKILNKEICGIVTDIPGLMNFENKKISLIRNSIIKYDRYVISKYSKLVLLTEEMNTLINFKKKPYIIMEGLVDINMSTTNVIINTEEIKHITYTGSIYEKFGVKTMLEAFLKLPQKNIILDIYGPGNMENDMYYYMSIDKRIKYHGTVSIDEAVEAQKKSYLLINPRPTNEEFAKYSFPSKNMEYMVTGIPLLTTKLPGMPKEYFSYVYLLEDESIEGFKEKINELLLLPSEDFFKKGDEAKKFVLELKNNIIQSRRIIEFIQE